MIGAEVLGILQRGPGVEGAGHQDLGLVVHARHVATLRDARGLAPRVEALHQLLVKGGSKMCAQNESESKYVPKKTTRVLSVAEMGTLVNGNVD